LTGGALRELESLAYKIVLSEDDVSHTRAESHEIGEREARRDGNSRYHNLNGEKDMASPDQDEWFEEDDDLS
jgi:hypothetical protein